MKESPLGRLLGWFLNHLVVLGFLAFAVVAVLYRGPLFGVGADAEESAIAPALAEATSGEHSQSAGEAAPVQSASDDQHDADSSHRLSSRDGMTDPSGDVSSPAGAAHTIEHPVAAEQADAGTVFRPLRGQAAVTERPSPRDLAASPPQAAGTVVAAPRFRTPDGQHPAPDRQASAQRLLKQAREAAWAGNTGEAERLYLRYLADRPEDASVFAELGQLYQSMGRTADAQDAYYEAGIRFRDSGQREQLRQIRNMLLEAADPRAGALRVN